MTDLSIILSRNRFRNKLRIPILLIMAVLSSALSSQLLHPNSAASASSPSLIRFKKMRRIAVAATTSRPYVYPTTNFSMSSASLYELLGISVGASCQEIKTAYRKLARVVHPDVVTIDSKDTCTDRFMKIHAAYSTLLDPQKRADYDRNLFRRHQMLSSPMPSSSSAYGYPRRSGSNWETDQCW